MIPRNRIPCHPGEILREEFLVPLGITPAALSQHLGVSSQRISELARERRRVTPELSWMLSQALGTTAEFWLNLQSTYDLARNRPRKRIARVKHAS
ncbi:MAG: HigA family addiction module antitoxin [Pirellulales bacterium]